MKRRRWMAPRLWFVVPGLSACASLIDLGPEATLADTGVGVAGGPAAGGVGASAGAAPASCYPWQVGPTCAACLDARCCDAGRACAADARCPELADRIPRCGQDVACILGFLAEHPDVQPLQDVGTCLSRCTVECSATGPCLELSACCQATETEVARSGCFNTVYTEDAQRCRDGLTTFASACPSGSTGAGG